ncbi:MAG: hypothetical protein HW389_3097 [Bacteroidetes bacterium]|nr:hypothetical protein [Bacteroidota bacterium]
MMERLSRAILWRIGFALLSVGFVVQKSSPQTYPAWFIEQGTLCRGRVAVGYADPSYFPDSSISRAAKNARENFARQKETHVQGGQLFWATEGGTYWMGADFREQYDAAASGSALASLVPVDTLVNSSMTLVLLTDRLCQINRAALRQVSLSGEAPRWTETLPQDGEYFYAVGVASEYYYEVSSWMEAERNARRNLARSVVVAVASLQKLSSREGQDIRREEISVSLSHIDVVARWRDRTNGIFYVLLRAPKEGNIR